MVCGLALTCAAVHGIGSAGGLGQTLWLVPGMFVHGAGMGMTLAPITSQVLAAVAPRHIGSAAGILATVVQVGGAVGVALIGIVFYGALSPVAPGHGYPRAFELSLVALAGAEVLLAALAQSLPRHRATAG
jgi:hypothetical protein